MVCLTGNRNIGEEAACFGKDEDKCFTILATSWDVRNSINEVDLNPAQAFPSNHVLGKMK